MFVTVPTRTDPPLPPLFQEFSVADSVEKEIHELRTLFWSERDPEGRVFAPLADAYRRQGDLDQALELLHDGLDRHSDFAPALVVAGWVRRDRGETEAAAAAFEAVLELDEENAEALRGVGELAVARGDRPAALESFQRLVDLEPGDREVVARLREIEVEQGEETISQFEVKVESVPPDASPESPPTQLPFTAQPDTLRSEDDDGPLTRTMADLYARQGHHSHALRVYHHLLEQTPDDPELRELVDAMAAPPAGRGTGGVVAPPRPTDAEMETLARDWTEGPRETGDLSTPLALTARSAQPTPPPSGLPVRDYFRTLLDWEPASPEQGAEDSMVVPIEALAPEVVDIATLAPDPPGSGRDEPGSQIERLP
jgi:tetratricopeptide (TPR) repeat protein